MIYVIIGMQMVFFEVIVHIRSVVYGKHWGKRICIGGESFSVCF